ncbi:MAG: thioredoxin [Muribaculaceae bacterium]|nr:thioredoxin [Muribaculaceae bacterium]
MNNFEQLIAGDKPVLVDFFATWCGPCKMMHPILEELKQSIGDRATIIKIDVDEAQEFAVQYGVRAVPTLAIFKRGQLVWREAGVHSAQQLIQALEPFV